jgi:hypothetical protein
VTTRKKEAGGCNPPATTRRQPLSYRRPTLASSRKLLEQAADVLLILEFPLAEIERIAFDCLFERRLRRAYAGGGQ